MAEECVDVPVISGVTMSRVGELRRRHSSGKTSPGNNGEKLVPYYVRGSTSSCHDFCKYGKKLALEEKKRSFIPRIAERKQLHRSTLENLAEVVTSGVKLRASMDSEPTKMSLVKHGKLTDSELRISNVSDTIKVVKTGPDEPVQPGNKVVVNRKKTSLVGVKRLPLLPKSQNSIIYKTRRQEISSSSKVDTTPKPISKRVGSIPNFKKEEPLLKSTSQRLKTHPISTSQMVKTSLKSTSKKTQTSSKFSEKHATSLNLDSSKLDSPRASSSSKSSRRRVAGINIHKSLKTASLVKNHPKPKKVEHEEHYNEAKEKNLYVIKIENEDNTFQSDQNPIQDIELSPSKSLLSSKFSSQEDQEESKYATSEFEEDSFPGNNGKENKETLEKLLDLEVEENEKPQKGEIENLAEAEIEKSSPTGNNGKDSKESLETLDLEVEENEKLQKCEIENLAETEIEKRSPSKLQFRGGKVLKDIATDGDETVARTGLEKIVLRHQDVKGKKDEQVLLNNVIEETASKLVETQKGKVKALVGAFETLISLNEKKT